LLLASIDPQSSTDEAGQVVYSTREQDKTYRFHVGAGNVMEGWEQAVLGMCIGESKSFKVPPQLAYTDRGYDELEIMPGGVSLIFDVELVAIHGSSSIPTLYSQIDTNSDMFITFEEMEAWFLKRRPSLVDLVRTAFNLDDTNRV